MATVATVDTARADCTRLLDCDIFNPDCYECTQPTAQLTGDNQSGDVDVVIGRSQGSDLGATVWRSWYPRMTRAAPPATPPQHVDRSDDARDRGFAFLQLQDLKGRARGGRVRTEVLDVLIAQRLDAMVRVPRDQGIERDISVDGEVRSADPDGDLSDPVDPITGELVVEHVDLALPSFGVSFSHSRTYRSRTDYDGPLGPGWDFSYNQRLVELTVVEPGYAAALEEGEAGLPNGSGGVEGMAPPDPSRHCGPVLALTTGTGSSLRFRETSQHGDALSYESAASGLTLRGVVAATGTTWTLTSRAGEVRRYDERGLLVAWLDSNGIGLRFAWEIGDVVDWRLASVKDSVGRGIQYRYDGRDRLIRVDEGSSGLAAVYEYDADGGLYRAVRGDGRSERYEYDVVAGRSRGDWIPEQQVESVCADACAMSNRSCDSGGACDAPVAAATSACLAACPACAEECGGECGLGCRQGCSNACGNECEAACEAGRAQFANRCEFEFQMAHGEEVCASCVDKCQSGTHAACDYVFSCGAVSVGSDVQVEELCLKWTGWDDLGQDGLRSVQFLFTGAAEGLWCVISLFTDCDFDSAAEVIDSICVDDVADCCAFGDDCGRRSCNEGVDCRDECRDTFMGVALGSSCPAPETPIECGGWGWDLQGSPAPHPDSEEYDALIACAGTASEWSQRNGCVPVKIAQCEEDCGSACYAPCRSECGAQCDSTCRSECHADDCLGYCIGLDLPGECEGDCTAACVDDVHARGAIGGPKYGYLADLQFNLVRVYDGNGRLYLENTYGADLRALLQV